MIRFWDHQGVVEYRQKVLHPVLDGKSSVYWDKSWKMSECYPGNKFQEEKTHDLRHQLVTTLEVGGQSEDVLEKSQAWVCYHERMGCFIQSVWEVRLEGHGGAGVRPLVACQGVEAAFFRPCFLGGCTYSKRCHKMPHRVRKNILILLFLLIFIQTNTKHIKLY